MRTRAAVPSRLPGEITLAGTDSWLPGGPPELPPLAGRFRKIPSGAPTTTLAGSNRRNHSVSVPYRLPCGTGSRQPTGAIPRKQIPLGTASGFETIALRRSLQPAQTLACQPLRATFRGTVSERGNSALRQEPPRGESEANSVPRPIGLLRNHSSGAAGSLPKDPFGSASRWSTPTDRLPTVATQA